MELQAKHNLTLKLLQFMREERLDQNSADDAIFFCGLAPEAGEWMSREGSEHQKLTV